MKLFKIDTCAGNKGCPNSANNTSELITKMEEIAKNENLEDVIRSKIRGPVRQHYCFKVGVANCPNACSQVQITDFAVIGKVKMEINEETCINCGKCTKFCFENALIMKEGHLVFKEENCVGCGLCLKACKEGSIKIKERGFMVLAGGKLGRHPMLALEISHFASFVQTVDIFKKVVKFYKDNSVAGERLGTIFQRKNLKNIDKIFL